MSTSPNRKYLLHRLLQGAVYGFWSLSLFDFAVLPHGFRCVALLVSPSFLTVSCFFAVFPCGFRCISFSSSLCFLISFTVFQFPLWIWPPFPSSFAVFPYGIRFISCSMSLYFLFGLTAFPFFVFDLATLWHPLMCLCMCVFVGLVISPGTFKGTIRCAIRGI